MWFHGHSHYGYLRHDKINDIPIYNVALFAKGYYTILQIDDKGF